METEERFQKLAKEVSSFHVFYSPAFRNPSKVLAPMPDEEKYLREQEKLQVKRREVIDDVANLFYVAPLLTSEQEFHLFRQMNYLQWFLSKRVRNISGCPSSEEMDSLEELLRKYHEIRNRIACANLRLTSQTVKGRNYSCELADQILTDGILHLFPVIDAFDFRREGKGGPMKFSTYATWCLKRRSYYVVDRNRTHQTRFVSAVVDDFDLFESSDLGNWHERNQSERKSVVQRLFAAVLESDAESEASPACLFPKRDSREAVLKRTQRELDVIRKSFGFEGEEQTLETIGRGMDITKERVRQIRVAGLKRLTRIAEEKGIVLDEFAV